MHAKAEKMVDFYRFLEVFKTNSRMHRIWLESLSLAEVERYTSHGINCRSSTNPYQSVKTAKGLKQQNEILDKEKIPVQS